MAPRRPARHLSPRQAVQRRPSQPRPKPRAVALDALARIDDGGAYANLVLAGVLERSGLDGRDKAFVTDLVYGVTRLRRRLDHLVDRFLLRPVDPPVRAALRLGAYQLHELRTPAHAAVSETVAAVADRRVRGLVNAVLRRVADAPVPDDAWPDVATRLSYPDWIIERVVADLGGEDGLAALAVMNEPAEVVTRADGYVQDRASQWVAESVGGAPGDRVLDLCAAPGGKATALATTGAAVVAGDVRPARARLVRENAARLDHPLSVVVADGRSAPFVAGSFDRVLVDAPCSGLGALRRRPDARWRIGADDVDRLAALQADLLAAAAALVRPGGLLVYSVCTLTEAEGPAVAATVEWPALPPPGERWKPWGSGARLLPQTAGTDGMFLARWHRP